jgi:hypothetical protein
MRFKPNPITPTLPASSPAVTDHAADSSPQPTDTTTNAKARDTSDARFVSASGGTPT